VKYMASAAPPANGGELTRAQLGASQQGELQGPYDFAWLLERVADFGTEEPTWRPAGQQPAWKPEVPPAPMQVLVPEMVLFDSGGNGMPSALVFTDRGGFLRAVRRPLHKEPGVMFDAMLQLMRSRQQIDSQAVKEFEAALQASDPMEGLTLKDTLEEDSEGFVRLSSCLTEDKAEKTKKQATPRAGEKLKPHLASHSQRKGWKLSVAGSSLSEKRLSDQEVAPYFGVAGDGRVAHWPKGSKLLQACFWTGMETIFGQGRVIDYHYNALETEVPGAEHTGLEAIITNHFERFRYLDGVRNRNMISAVPNLFAKHLSYYCNLELVTGDFGFIKDNSAQLWLVEAKNLLFLPNVSRAGANAQAASSGEALPQKLFRYLSEEALQSMPVKPVEGEKCERMMGMMISYYQGLKDHFRVEKMLSPEHEEIHVNIPVLEGTDKQAMAKTFGLTGLLGTKREGNAGAANSDHRFAAPKKSMPVGRGRWFSSEAAQEAAAMATKGRSVNPIIEKGRKAKAKAEAERTRKSRFLPVAVSVNSERLESFALTEQNVQQLTPLMLKVPGRDADEASTTSRPQSSSEKVPGKRRPSKRPASRHRTQKSEAPQRTQIEIVSTPVADELLHGAGTGECPQGPTLDSWTRPGHLARVPGQGLITSKKEAAPRARAVVVPPGAVAAAMARVSAREKEAAALEAEKIRLKKNSENAHRKTVSAALEQALESSTIFTRVAGAESVSNSFVPSTYVPNEFRDLIGTLDEHNGMELQIPKSRNPDGPHGHASLVGFLAAPL